MAADALRLLRSVESARDAAAAGRDRFAFLAETSRQLAESLDYETTLATVAGLALPYLGAWAMVDVLLEDAKGVRIRRLAVLHPDPAKQEVARTLHHRYPPHPDDLIGAPRVMRTHRPEVVVGVSDDALAAVARDADHLALLRALGTRAYVIVPMVARGRTLGAITFITADAAARFGDADLLLAEEVARRAAVAVDNARLHAEAEAARRAAEHQAAQATAAAERARTAEAAAATAMEAVAAALATRGQFLATMSHELRTPLNAILGYAELLDTGVLGPATPAQHGHLERLQASARHLLRLIDDVLDLAKADAGRLAVRRDALDTGTAVAAAIALVQPQATAKGVRLLDLGASGPGVPSLGVPSFGVPYAGDEHRVRQILVNLLSNAVKFTPPGGRVTVTCGAAAALGEALSDGPDPGAPAPSDAAWAYIRIADTGPGLAPDVLAAVFEPFVQGDGALTRAHGGTGLGLAISRQLARLMGGDVTAQSAPGHGATFTLWLPAPPPVAPEAVADAVGGVVADSTSAPVSVRAAAVPPAGAPPPARFSPPLGAVAVAEPAGSPLDGPAYAVLHALGGRLAAEAETVAERYVAALRADGRFPGARDLPAAQLRDHVTSFVGLLASQLAVIGETRGEAPELLGDGSQVQRLMAELHGAQRHRLGWAEADLARETAILRAEVERAIRDALGRAVLHTEDTVAGAESATSAAAAAQYALTVTRHVLDRAFARAVQAYRAAQAAEAS